VDDKAEVSVGSDNVVGKEVVVRPDAMERHDGDNVVSKEVGVDTMETTQQLRDEGKTHCRRYDAQGDTPANDAPCLTSCPISSPP